MLFSRSRLALYAEKNVNDAPILADSLTVVVGSEKVPEEYETGIHLFGSSAAFNLNNKLYDWNDEAPAVFNYFQKDTVAQTAGNAGTNFTAGTLAIAGGVGIILGAVVTVIAFKAKKKKENKENETI